MDTKEQNYIIERFRKAAFIYDFSFLPLRWLRKKALQAAGNPENKSILDVCTGTGGQALAFAQKGNRVYGVDISEEMLRLARKKRGAQNIVYSNASCTELDFKDNFFDLAIISFGLHEMPAAARSKALKEIRRVLKNNADFIVVDYSMPESRFIRFFALSFLNLYECRYYPEFVRSDVVSMIAGQGFLLKEKTDLVLGSVMIMLFSTVKN